VPSALFKTQAGNRFNIDIKTVEGQPMTYSEFYRQNVLATAREHIKRHKEAKMAQEARNSTTLFEPPVEDRMARWRREAAESDAARAAARRELSTAERTHIVVTSLQTEVAKIKSDIVASLQGVSAFAEAVNEKIEALEAKLAASESKVADLTKALERNQRVVDLPAKRHA
jgi:chromosome segregation ATPase